MKSSFLLFFSVVFSLSLSINSQSNIWLHFTPENSLLPSLHISSIHQDNNGNYWVGCLPFSFALNNYPGGLVKILNNNWEIFNNNNSGLVSHTINDITSDAIGNIWIASDSGLIKYDGINWFVYNETNSGLPSNKIYLVKYDTNGTLWIVTYYDGLVKYDGTNWERYHTGNSNLLSDDIESIAIDKNGILWLGLEGYGLSRFDGSIFTRVSSPSFLSGLSYVLALGIGKDNSKWIGATGSAIKFGKYDDAAWTLFDSTIIGSNPSPIWKGIVTDTNNFVWFGTNTGLFKYDYSNWKKYDKSNSTFPLPGDVILSLYSDKNNNLLFCPSDGLSPQFNKYGLMVFNENGINGITSINDFSKSIKYDYKLYQNYPNPFNPSTNFTYWLSQYGHVSITLFDYLGKEIVNLFDGLMPEGYHQLRFDANRYNLSSGVYFYVFTLNGIKKETFKIIYLR